MKGYVIRQFFRELLGSRVAETIADQLLTNRNDFDQRLAEKDRHIADMREELAQARAKLERCEMALLPMVYGGVLGERPKPPVFEPVVESSWETYRENWDKEQAELARLEAEATKQETNNA